MNTAILSLAFLAGLSAMAQTNQPAVEDFKPSSLNQPGKQYPQVNSERRVRARVGRAAGPERRAPIPGWRNIPLDKGDDGAWSATRGLRTKVFTITNSSSMAPGSRTPAACISTAATAGAAVSKSRPKTRTSMPPRMCRMASCGRRFTIPRIPMPCFAASFTPRLTMKRSRPSVIRVVSATRRR